MKKLYTKVLCALLMVLAMTGSQKSFAQDAKSMLKKVADAHGFNHWKDVNSIDFTFNVDRDTTHFERSWVWDTRANKVTATGPDGTTEYSRTKMDSTAEKTNANFVNDKYWLLAPYQLMWDADNFKPEYTAKASAPISKKPMQKLTIVYGSEGGYTPGDAYDFYFMDDFMVREWVFRKGNQKEASMTNTWEDYQNFDGLKIATAHKNEDGTFKLYFTDVEVDMD